MENARTRMPAHCAVLACFLAILASAAFVHAAKGRKAHAVCALCDSVAVLLDTLPKVRVSKAEATGAQHQCLARTRTVCSLTWDGTFKDFPADAAPHDVLSQRLERSGWRQVLECMADGPDGTSLAFARDSIAVVIEAQWDGGDDSDPDYAPRDFYKLRILCGVIANAHESTR